MANEINATVELTLSNGVDNFTSKRGKKQITQSTTRPAVLSATSTQNVTTSDAALTLPNVAAGNLGFAVFENLDSGANYIDIGPASGGAMVAALRLYAGEQALLRLIPSTTYRAQSSSGTQVLAIGIVAK